MSEAASEADFASLSVSSSIWGARPHRDMRAELQAWKQAKANELKARAESTRSPALRGGPRWHGGTAGSPRSPGTSFGSSRVPLADRSANNIAQPPSLSAKLLGPRNVSPLPPARPPAVSAAPTCRPGIFHLASTSAVFASRLQEVEYAPQNVDYGMPWVSMEAAACEVIDVLDMFEEKAGYPPPPPPSPVPPTESGKFGMWTCFVDYAICNEDLQAAFDEAFGHMEGVAEEDMPSDSATPSSPISRVAAQAGPRQPDGAEEAPERRESAVSSSEGVSTTPRGALSPISLPSPPPSPPPTVSRAPGGDGVGESASTSVPSRPPSPPSVAQAAGVEGVIESASMSVPSHPPSPPSVAQAVGVEGVIESASISVPSPPPSPPSVAAGVEGVIESASMSVPSHPPAPAHTSGASGSEDPSLRPCAAPDNVDVSVAVCSHIEISEQAAVTGVTVTSVGDAAVEADIACPSDSEPAGSPLNAGSSGSGGGKDGSVATVAGEVVFPNGHTPDVTPAEAVCASRGGGVEDAIVADAGEGVVAPAPSDVAPGDATHSGVCKDASASVANSNGVPQTPSAWPLPPGPVRFASPAQQASSGSSASEDTPHESDSAANANPSGPQLESSRSAAIDTLET